MAIILRIIILCLMFLPTAAFAAEIGLARISLIKGDVQIYTDDTREWVAASINMPLREGDRIWVPEGARTEVHIQGGVYIRIGSASSFDILALQEESYQFYLNGGHAYINNRKGGIDHIQVDTPQTSVGCYDNSLVMIDVAQSGATDISALKGYAAAETRNGKTRVGPGNTLHIGADMTAELSPLAPPDQWENWNRERDRKLAAGNRSLRYIPENLDDYAYELDDYGRWVYVTDYGYCWTPLRVSVGWSPYRLGRWCWIGGDYVWISYEPWGWVPHHYGRWTFVVNFGWCWVPPPVGEVFWAPGYVGWVHTPAYVAWVPLAPGEIYYGRGNYGPRSVNITNVTINRTVVQNFRNVNVRNAVTVVNRDAFITGRKEPVRVKGNPFRAANVDVGLPVIKPTKAAAMPVVRNIPPGRRPPERVRRVSVDEIRRERKLVPEEKGSVFRPERPGTSMPVRKSSEPQAKIREEHPALPPAKPSRREPPVTRGERKPTSIAPEVTQRRPVPQPAASAPPAQRPQSVIPGRPTPQPHAGTLKGMPPRQERPVREPRWQEPVPAGGPGMQRRGGPPAAPVMREGGVGKGHVKPARETMGTKEHPTVSPVSPKPEGRKLETRPQEKGNRPAEK